MGASGTPIFKTVSVTDAGVTLNFGQQVQTFALYNAGPNTAFFAEGAVAPTASRGDSRYGLNSGESLSLPLVNVQKLSFICDTGETASIQAVGIPVGEVDLDTPSASTYNTIDLSAFGVLAAPDVAGPIVFTDPIPLANFADFDLSFLTNNTLTEHMSVGQGDVSDTGYLKVLIEAELDSDTVYHEIMKFHLSIGGGGSGGGGAGASFFSQKTMSLDDLKALGSTITSMQATISVVQTDGVGSMTGAVDFTNFALTIFGGTKGADYA